MNSIHARPKKPAARWRQLRKLTVVLAVLWPGVAPAADDDTLIVPGERVGFITRSTTEADIQKRLEPSQYRRDLIDVGEGEGRRALILFPNSDREIAILWKSDKETLSPGQWEAAWNNAPALERPEYILIVPPNSPWHTAEGVRVGVTMKKLETINGGPFTFNGFGWLHSGRLRSWEEGRLSAYLSVELRSESGEDNFSEALYGDLAVWSNNPEFKNTPFYVDLIMVAFPDV